MSDEPAVCTWCGTRAPSVPPPLGWSACFERGRRTWICEPCARANMRSIEAKLDSEWW